MLSLHDYLMNNGFSITHNAATGYVEYSSPRARVFSKGSSTQTIFAEEFSIRGEAYLENCRIDTQSFGVAGLNRLVDVQLKGLFVSFESSTVRNFGATSDDPDVDLTMIVHVAKSTISGAKVAMERSSKWILSVNIWQSTLESVDLYPTDNEMEINQCVIRHRRNTFNPHLSVVVPGRMTAYSCVTSIDEDLSAQNIPPLLLDANSHLNGFMRDAWGNLVPYQQFGEGNTGVPWLMIDNILAPQSKMREYLEPASQGHYSRVALDRYMALVDYLETYAFHY